MIIFGIFFLSDYLCQNSVNGKTGIFIPFILSAILKSKIPMNSRKGSLRFIKFRNGIFTAHTTRFKTKSPASNGTIALHFAAKKARAKPRINREIHLYIKNDVETREHNTNYNAKLCVEKGDEVKAGDKLTIGYYESSSEVIEVEKLY